MSETAQVESAQLPAVVADPGLVAQISSGIDIGDRAMISGYGDKAQREVAAFADRVLAQTRNKEMGDTGKLLLDILDKARGLDPAELKDAGIIERLVSSAERRLRRFIGRFEDVAAQIETIIIQLEQHKDLLRRDISMLDDLHEETRRAIVFLEAHVAAGKAFVQQFKSGRLEELRAKAGGGGASGQDLMAAQEYQDAVQAVDRLEKRIFYLQQARQIGIQQMPQIRIVQSGDETLIENLQATTQITIPVWKQKMILLLGLTRQSAALELQKTVTDATNKMMRQASEMMKEQAIDIEEQAQRGIVDLDTLEKTNRDLIETVNSVLQVQREGRQKRAAVETRMEQLNTELKTALSQPPA